jgi:hypothetical protein
METSFEFKSTYFNNSVPKDDFVNPGCYGDDLAVWLIEKLKDSGVETVSGPEPEDYGWYFKFRISGIEYCVVVGFQPNDVETGDCWLGWIERDVAFLQSLFGGRHRGIAPEAVEAIDSVLRSAPEVNGLKWVTV